MERSDTETASPRSATIDATFAQFAGIVFLLAALFVVAGPYVLLWGRDAFDAAARWPTAVAIFAGLLVHELLHCVGFLLGGAPRASVRIGYDWKRVLPFASCSEPLRCSGYRFAVVLPTLVLGLLPAALGLVTGNGEAAIFGALLIGTAAGDMLILWALRDVPGDAMVEDHPSEIGCRVLTASQPLERAL